MTVHADGEFDPVRELIVEMSSGPMVNLTSNNDHSPKIERRIRVAKERFRATRHSLPLMRLTVILNINIVLNNIKLLGYLTKTADIFTTISPRAIMTSETLNFKRHLDTCWSIFPNTQGRDP